MFNNLALIVRRPDIDRREFRDHYEDIHAPLALPYMKGLRAYQRNHIQVALDGVEPPFDVLSQFAYESVESAALSKRIPATGFPSSSDRLRSWLPPLKLEATYSWI